MLLLLKEYVSVDCCLHFWLLNSHQAFLALTSNVFLSVMQQSLDSLSNLAVLLCNTCTQLPYEPPFPEVIHLTYHTSI